MGVAKKSDRFYDFVDSEVQCLFYKNRSVENTQIPSPWLFFMDSHRSTHDSGIKIASYYSFKKLVDVVLRHTVLLRHVMMRGEWSVIHLRGLFTKP
jgi:hypothetical protein